MDPQKFSFKTSASKQQEFTALDMKKIFSCFVYINSRFPFPLDSYVSWYHVCRWYDSKDNGRNHKWYIYNWRRIILVSSLRRCIRRHPENEERSAGGCRDSRGHSSSPPASHRIPPSNSSQPFASLPHTQNELPSHKQSKLSRSFAKNAPRGY